MNRELIERMNKVSARSLDGNVVMGSAEWNEIVGLVGAALSQEAEPVASQDVEEFIAAHDYDKEDMCSGCVPSSALREWMDGHARVPVGDSIPIRGIVTGVLQTKKNIEVALEHNAELPTLGERIFITNEKLLRSIGVSGEGHNADWCAGWNACLLLSTKVETCTYKAMLTASKESESTAASQQEGV